MKIFHYQYSLAPEIGGPARAVIDLATGLARRGHEVSIATGDPKGAPAEWTDTCGAAGPTGTPALEVLPLPRWPMGLFGRDTLDRLHALIDRHDVLHLHGIWGPWNLQLGAAARRLGKPYFISAHGMLDDWCMRQHRVRKLAFMALVGRRWLERAEAVHLTAPLELKQSRNHFPKGNGVVVPYLLDLHPFEVLQGPEAAHKRLPVLANGRPNVLFLSRVHVKKGIATLLRAARLLHDRGTPFNLIIAGNGEPGYVGALKNLAANLGIERSTHFVGMVTGWDKLSLYQASEVLVVPTSQENFGLVFVEALACGTPVITTRCVDIWPELQRSGGALLIGASPGATAEAVSDLLSNRPKRQLMGIQGRAGIFEWLNSDRILDRMEAMYEGRRLQRAVPCTRERSAREIEVKAVAPNALVPVGDA